MNVGVVMQRSLPFVRKATVALLGIAYVGCQVVTMLIVGFTEYVELLPGW